MKTLDQGALTFAAANRIPSGIRPHSIVAFGLLDRNNEQALQVLDGAIVLASGIGLGAAGGGVFSPRGIHTGQHAAYVSTDGNDSTPVITETYNSEIAIPANCTITGVALFNGSNVTGNVLVGLADYTGAPILAAQSIATAGSGTTAYQLVPFAAPYAAKGPATFFIQVQYSSGTARYRAHTLGTHAVGKQTGQTFGTLTSFVPPTTFTTLIGNLAGLY